MRAGTTRAVRIFLQVLSVLGAVLLAQSAQSAQAGPSLSSYGPQGLARATRQVSMQFSDDVVAQGDDKAADPAEIACVGTDEKPKGHWMDGRHWVGEFAHPLPDGVACSVTPHALASLTGATFTAAPWTFNTGGPIVGDVHAELRNQSFVTEYPVMAFYPSVATDEASLKNLTCTINNQASEVHILSGAEREFAISRLIEKPWRDMRIAFGRTPKSSRSGKIANPWGDKNPEQYVVARCGEGNWPAKGAIVYYWGRNIASKTGVVNASEQRYMVNVRPEFTATPVCRNMPGTKEGACDSREVQSGGIKLRFSEQIDRAVAAQVLLRGGSGKVYTAKHFWGRGSTTNELEFDDDVANEDEVTMALPTVLNDVDQRPLSNREEVTTPRKVAHLPVYVGMAARYGERQWDEGQPVLWPVATRNTEASLTVHGWRFAPASSDIPTLLALRDIADPLFESATLQWWDRVKSWNPERAFAASDALLESLPGRPAHLMEQHITPTDKRMHYTTVPLTGNGTWVVEVDSPAYRALMTRQRQELMQRGLIQDPSIARTSPVDKLFNETQSLFGNWMESRVAVVQVTNLHVSLKASSVGESLVWVTALDTGRPVAGALVETWSKERKQMLQVKTDAEGRALLPPAQFGDTSDSQAGWIVVQAGTDMAILRVDQHFAPDRNNLMVHTVVDRILVHPGEIMSMQHIARLAGADGWSLPLLGQAYLRIYEQGAAKPLFEEKIGWNADGSAQTTWRVPHSAKLGWYRVQVEENGYRAGRAVEVQVGEFRTPGFEAGMDASVRWGRAHDEGQSLALSAQLSFLSGGRAAGQSVTLKGAYSLYAKAPVAGYAFYEDDDDEPRTDIPAFADMTVTLDKEGHARRVLAVPVFDQPLTLESEMQFADPNGEIQTQQASVTFWPKRHKLGLKIAASEQANVAQIGVIALDESDKPLAQQSVVVNTLDPDGERKDVCVIKTDAEGKGSCSMPWKEEQDFSDWRLAAHAEDASAPVIDLRRYDLRWGDPNKKAPLRILASDALSNTGEALRVVVHAPFLPAYALFTFEREGVLASELRRVTSDDEIVELPTQARFAPSLNLHAQFVRGMDSASDMVTAKSVETAPMPSPAKAQGEPLLAARPISADTMIRVAFAESPNRLRIAVLPAQSRLLPGATLSVKVNVRRERGEGAIGNGHVTLVAVDDALLALKPNQTWNVLDGFWRDRHGNIQYVDNSAYASELPGTGGQYFPPVENILLHYGNNEKERIAALVAGAAIGDRYGTDAYAPGILGNVGFLGGKLNRVEITGSNIRRSDIEGDAAPRTNFSTLAFWQADVKLDANGEAQFSIPMPDTLTRWRIVAIATGGADLFGTGETTVQTDKPMQIVSGLPQTVRSGDVLMQKITLRNTTKTALDLVLRGSAGVTPDAQSSAPRITAKDVAARGLQWQKRLKMKAGENRVVEWQLAVPDDVKALDWRFQAEAKNAGGKLAVLDALVLQQTVVPALPVTVREASLVQLDQERAWHVQRPDSAVPERGGVVVSWQRNLTSAALSGVKRWMEDYPYGCMEQLLSKAVVSGEPAQWQAIIERLPGMLDQSGLVRYFPDTPGSDVMTAYVLDMADAANLNLPPALAERMREGLRNALEKELSQNEQEWMSPNERLSRRLALQASLGGDLGNSGKIVSTIPEEVSALPTIALLDWIRYLQNQAASAQRQNRLQEAGTELRQRFDRQGTRLVLRSDGRDQNGWFMWNADMVEARAILVAQKSFADSADWKDELPGLVGSLIDRQQAGHWATTVANAWGSSALRAFAEKTENGPVLGSSIAELGARHGRAVWPADPSSDTPAPVTLPWTHAGSDELRLRHEGQGAPWATVQLQAAVPGSSSIAHGVSVEKTLSPVQQKIKGVWSVGDIMRVTLNMTSDARQSWLAVRDPIPSGATIMGKGLGGESMLAQRSGGQWWWNPSSAELGSESYRGYYQHIWNGKWQATYLVRLNNAGVFSFPATRIEAMYAPEIFGESPNAVLNVVP